MASQIAKKPSDSTLVFIKVSRVITYIVYAYSLVASVFLALAFFLELFGANSATSFVSLVYKASQGFLNPFRDIFPTHSVSATGYFNASALFAIIIYLLFAVCRPFAYLLPDGQDGCTRRIAVGSSS